MHGDAAQPVTSTDVFERHRSRLHAVAYRMLGSAGAADDVLQEAWLRVDRAGMDGIDNPAGWLTTIVSRLCLTALRARDTRREQPLSEIDLPPASSDPERDAELADSVGVAMLVVLGALTPPERLAFVLHDMFAVPFDEIGPMIERTPTSARQLASRARRKVKGAPAVAEADLSRRREVVGAFLTATRAGDFEALVALLHPDVVLRADKAAVPSGKPVLTRGADVVARGAMAATGRARFTGLALVDGRTGLVMAPEGKPRVVLTFTIDGDAITEIDVIADDDRLGELEIAAG